MRPLAPEFRGLAVTQSKRFDTVVLIEDGASTLTNVGIYASSGD
jgi:hypothetical protein